MVVLAIRPTTTNGGASYVVEGTLAPGTYTVKIGVFSGDWSVLHQWDNQAGTFVVR